jgi:MFS transporter, DHA1 family, multidrug resistance protein
LSTGGLDLERWKFNLYTIWIIQIISLTGFGFGLPFIPFYIQELGVVDPDAIKRYSGLLASAPAISMAVTAPIWGILADKYGKKLMLLRAMLFGSLIIAGMGFVTSIGQLVALRFAQGLFTGTITAASALIAAGTPENKLSYSLGFLSSSTFIGMTLGPVLGGYFAEFAGYRPSFWIGGGLVFLNFLLALFLVKESKSIQTMKNSVPVKSRSILSIFSKALVMIVATIVFLRIARTVFVPYLPIFVQETRAMIEGSSRITGIISGIAGLCTALSGLTLSRLGDRYEKPKLLRIMLAVGAVFSIPLFFAGNLTVFAVFYGLFFFLLGGVEPVITSHLSENTPPEKRGALFGILGLVGGIGWAVAPTIGSAISIEYTIQSIFLVIPVALSIAIILTSISLKWGREHSHTDEINDEEKESVYINKS